MKDSIKGHFFSFLFFFFGGGRGVGVGDGGGKKKEKNLRLKKNLTLQYKITCIFNIYNILFNPQFYNSFT